MLSHVFESGLYARAPREERVRTSEQDLTRPVAHLEERREHPPVVGVSLEHHDAFSLTFPWGVLQKAERSRYQEGFLPNWRGGPTRLTLRRRTKRRLSGETQPKGQEKEVRA